MQVSFCWQINYKHRWFEGLPAERRVCPICAGAASPDCFGRAVAGRL